MSQWRNSRMNRGMSYRTRCNIESAKKRKKRWVIRKWEIGDLPEHGLWMLHESRCLAWALWLKWPRLLFTLSEYHPMSAHTAFKPRAALWSTIRGLLYSLLIISAPTTKRHSVTYCEDRSASSSLPLSLTFSLAGSDLCRFNVRALERFDTSPIAEVFPSSRYFTWLFLFHDDYNYRRQYIAFQRLDYYCVSSRIRTPDGERRCRFYSTVYCNGTYSTWLKIVNPSLFRCKCVFVVTRAL